METKPIAEQIKSLNQAIIKEPASRQPQMVEEPKKRRYES